MDEKTIKRNLDKGHTSGRVKRNSLSLGERRFRPDNGYRRCEEYSLKGKF